PGEELLIERAGIVPAGLGSKPTANGKPGRDRECPSAIAFVEFSRFLSSRTVVVEIEKGLNETRSRPRRFRRPGICGEQCAVGLDSVSRLTGGTAPPAKRQEAIRRQDARVRRRERLESRHGALVLTEPSKRLAQPKVCLGGYRTGGAWPRWCAN